MKRKRPINYGCDPKMRWRAERPARYGLYWARYPIYPAGHEDCPCSHCHHKLVTIIEIGTQYKPSRLVVCSRLDLARRECDTPRMKSYYKKMHGRLSAKAYDGYEWAGPIKYPWNTFLDKMRGHGKRRKRGSR